MREYHLITYDHHTYGRGKEIGLREKICYDLEELKQYMATQETVMIDILGVYPVDRRDTAKERQAKIRQFIGVLEEKLK